jgi:dTDP-4-dehydrorhamnose 3,5-epimerase-like enzyme
MTNIKTLKTYEDDRGSLLPIEFSDIPFTPKRIFVVNNVPQNTIRGNHSHHKTQQLLICLNGEIEVILYDGFDEKIILLKKNERYLIESLIWDSQKFLTENSELLVICSTSYDINDYILNLKEFKNIKKNEKK